MGKACSIFGPEFIEALKQSSFDYVDRLYADAGVTDGMASEETTKRINAEHARRAKLHAEQEAEAEFWRAVQRRREREDW